MNRLISNKILEPLLLSNYVQKEPILLNDSRNQSLTEKETQVELFNGQLLPRVELLFIAHFYKSIRFVFYPSWKLKTECGRRIKDEGVKSLIIIATHLHSLSGLVVSRQPGNRKVSGSNPTKTI